ncbi:MAG: DUF4338 domain-containing protein [Deltaproteobacteria bacterium]|nr:DUF4338 domain-containing protein [Deltaproteobacteria bacterium]
MDTEFKYRGQVYSTKQIAFIKQLIAENPEDSRWALSKKLCLAWNWVQKNGVLRDMVCRSFMLELHRAGLIELPAKKQDSINNLAERKKQAWVDIDRSPVCGSLSALGPIQFAQVRYQAGEGLCNSLIEQYHYLGYVQPVGEHLKYLISAGGRPIACLTLSSAPRHIGCRDRFIGWSKDVRLKNLHLIAYNSRFLILPWVEVRYLASHLLSRVARRISGDWLALYHHPVYYLETFVDTERYVGTCYYAANWQFLGKTTGRGKAANSHKPNRSIKDVLGYPLSRDFRQKLGVE